MDVRVMVPGDYSKVFGLLERTAHSSLRSREDSFEGFSVFLQRNPGLSFVVEDDEGLLGALVAGHDGRRGYVYHVAVKDPSRAKLITRAMLEKLYKKMESERIYKIGLLVDAENDIGVAFWMSNGWTKREDLMYFNKVVFSDYTND